MSMQSQCERLLDHMRAGNKVTSFYAMRCLGISRLASRVNDLRRQGHDVRSEWVDVENRHGEKTRIKRYWMEVDDE